MHLFLHYAELALAILFITALFIGQIWWQIHWRSKSILERDEKANITTLFNSKQ